jgi:hypothetical protein
VVLSCSFSPHYPWQAIWLGWRINLVGSALAVVQQRSVVGWSAACLLDWTAVLRLSFCCSQHAGLCFTAEPL